MNPSFYMQGHNYSGQAALKPLYIWARGVCAHVADIPESIMETRTFASDISKSET